MLSSAAVACVKPAASVWSAFLKISVPTLTVTSLDLSGSEYSIYPAVRADPASSGRSSRLSWSSCIQPSRSSYIELINSINLHPTNQVHQPVSSCSDVIQLIELITFCPAGHMMCSRLSWSDIVQLISSVNLPQLMKLIRLWSASLAPQTLSSCLNCSLLA